MSVFRFSLFQFRLTFIQPMDAGQNHMNSNPMNPHPALRATLSHCVGEGLMKPSPAFAGEGGPKGRMSNCLSIR